MNLAQFSHIAPIEANELIPDGNYNARITNAEFLDTKDGLNKRLTIEGTLEANTKHNGRKVWVNLNLVNQNPETVRIAEEQFGKLLGAIKVQNVQSTTDLLNKMVNFRVVTRESAGYAPRNEVRGFKPFTPMTQTADVPF